MPVVEAPNPPAVPAVLAPKIVGAAGFCPKRPPAPEVFVDAGEPNALVEEPKALVDAPKAFEEAGADDPKMLVVGAPEAAGAAEEAPKMFDPAGAG